MDGKNWYYLVYTRIIFMKYLWRQRLGDTPKLIQFSLTIKPCHMQLSVVDLLDEPKSNQQLHKQSRALAELLKKGQLILNGPWENCLEVSVSYSWIMGCLEILLLTQFLVLAFKWANKVLWASVSWLVNCRIQIRKSLWCTVAWR